MRTSWATRVADVADLVVWLAGLQPPTLGKGRLVCIDGPAGAGKSTLGEAVRDAAAQVGTTDLVHLDDLLEGWGGLPRVAATLERDVLRPLATGVPGRYRRWDWGLDRYVEEVPVAPVDLLVVEGVASGAAAHADLVTTLVWVDAPADLCLERGLARDGEELREQWLAWTAAEQDLFSRESTRERAGLRVDGTGRSDTAVELA